jgi:hypothetical protein
MKHILNDLSNEEKNSIREQHTGGMKVMTENFSRLLNAKLGDAKPLVNEEEIGLSDQSTESLDFNPEELNSTLSPLGITTRLKVSTIPLKKSKQVVSSGRLSCNNNSLSPINIGEDQSSQA